MRVIIATRRFKGAVFVVGLVLILAAIFLAACGAGAGPVASDGADSDPAAAQIEALLEAMPLEDRVGQLFMIHAHGPAIGPTTAAAAAANLEMHGVETIAQVIQTFHPGGIAYFEWTDNIESVEQVAQLSNDIQAEALGVGVGIPLLMGIDQEHGVVRRVAEPAAQFPGNMALGATGQLEDAYQAALVTARELRALGVNLNFAPVADVNINPDNPIIGTRSFGDRPGEVSALTAMQVQGYIEGGVAATAKHFPGHGDTDVDSHTGLPLIEHSREELVSVDLPPFQAAIDAGVDAVMTAHIVVPALDPSGRPATLSELILTDLLRGTMGFEGVIITDALTMDAVNSSGDTGQVAVMALQAGADILLMPPAMKEAFPAVLDAVAAGELSIARIDQSVRRILRLKQKLGLLSDTDGVLVDIAALPMRVGTEAHWQGARDIAARSITLIRDDAGLLPLTVGPEQQILVTGWGETTVALLGEALARKGLNITTLTADANPDEGVIATIVAAAGDSSLVVAVTRNVHADKGQQALIQGLVRTGTPVVVVMVGVPYDVRFLPTAGTVAATYGYRAVSLEAAAAVLVGDLSPRGRLPVTIPGADDPTQTLYPAGHGVSYGP